MLTRLIDFLKVQQVTTLFTSLTSGGSLPRAVRGGHLLSHGHLADPARFRKRAASATGASRSSSRRGMAHSNQVREFLLTDHGIALEDVYLGPSGVLTGSARAAQEAKERMAEAEAANEVERTRREIERKRVLAEAQIAALRAGMEADEEELKKLAQQEKNRGKALIEQREQMAARRGADRTETRAQDKKTRKPRNK